MAKFPNLKTLNSVPTYDPQRCNVEWKYAVQLAVSYCMESNAIYDGQQMKMRGKGNGIWGGIDGDLVINLKIIPDANFERRGPTLLHRTQAGLVDLILGYEIIIPHFDGPLKVQVPPLTDFKKPLKLKEKGFLDENGFKGDLYVYLTPEVPTQITNTEKELLHQLKKETNF